MVETETIILMPETKKRDDLNTDEVKAKAAAARWCEYASEHAAAGGKPWKYVLIPHDEVKESKRLADFLRFGVRIERYRNAALLRSFPRAQNYAPFLSDSLSAASASAPGQSSATPSWLSGVSTVFR